MSEQEKIGPVRVEVPLRSMMMSDSYIWGQIAIQTFISNYQIAAQLQAQGVISKQLPDPFLTADQFMTNLTAYIAMRQEQARGKGVDN